MDPRLRDVHEQAKSLVRAIENVDERKFDVEPPKTVPDGYEWTGAFGEPVWGRDVAWIGRFRSGTHDWGNLRNWSMGPPTGSDKRRYILRPAKGKIAYKTLRADGRSLTDDYGAVFYPLSGEWVDVPDPGAFVTNIGGELFSAIGGTNGVGDILVEMECLDENTPTSVFSPHGVEVYRRVRVVRVVPWAECPECWVEKARKFRPDLFEEQATKFKAGDYVVGTNANRVRRVVSRSEYEKAACYSLPDDAIGTFGPDGTSDLSWSSSWSLWVPKVGERVWVDGMERQNRREHLQGFGVVEVAVGHSVAWNHNQVGVRLAGPPRKFPGYFFPEDIHPASFAPKPAGEGEQFAGDHDFKVGTWIEFFTTDPGFESSQGRIGRVVSKRTFESGFGYVATLSPGNVAYRVNGTGCLCQHPAKHFRVAVR